MFNLMLKETFIVTCQILFQYWELFNKKLNMEGLEGRKGEML